MDQTELGFMRMAIQEARKDSRTCKVGAVVVKDGTVLEKAHGGEMSEGDHAEYTVFERKLIAQDVQGATLYVTLEPCTITYHPTYPRKTCVQIVKAREISRVVIGILDPNPYIDGTGAAFLRKHGVKVDFFPKELAREIEGLMPDWVQKQRTRRRKKYEALFSLLENYRNRPIAPYPGVAVLDALSLRFHSNITHGWLMPEVETHHETTKSPLPLEYQSPYQDYLAAFCGETGFKTDNPNYAASPSALCTERHL